MTRLAIDSTALDQARADLGLVLDVRVIPEKLTSTKLDPDTFVQGRYTGVDPFHGWHNIYVHKNLVPKVASAALWHELTHAVQCERWGSYPRFDAEYKRQQRELGVPYGSAEYFRRYVNMPFEAEAWSATALAKAGQLALLVYACD